MTRIACDVLITMFTDISLCHTTGRGAYAVWAKESGDTFRYANLFKEPVSDSNQAEIMAIVNGTALVLRWRNPPPGSVIIAQTDSQAAIGCLSGLGATAFSKLRMAQASIVQKSEIRIQYRHVKGHRGVRTRRNAVNTWCDRACRRLLSK